VSFDRTVDLSPITSEDLSSVADFLHAHLDGRLSPEQWAAALTPSWAAPQPNHGFMLRDGERVVGAYLAFYSDRLIDARRERFCNLSAWCVLDDYRSHSLRLLRAMLAQKDVHFTDFSPSGRVVRVNERMRFAHLDTTTAVVPNLPVPPFARGVRVISRPEEIERALTGADLAIYRDHRRAPAARHVVVVVDGAPCYVMFRRVRRKRLPLFASILHVGDVEVFRRAAPFAFGHMLLRHGIPVTLAETRVVGHRPRWTLAERPNRRKMYRSATLRPDQIDYLYSELTCVPW
jgi:hypothetical protein